MKGLDLHHVNAYLLHKQHLSVEARSSDMAQIINDICGLHATNPTTPYLSLFDRCPDFRKDLLEGDLYVRKRAARIRCVRKTIYIHTKSMLPVVYAATKPLAEEASKRYMEARGVTPGDYEEISKAILEWVSTEEMTASAIRKRLATSMNVSPILYYMCDQGLLIRGQPLGGWKSKNQRYASFHNYFPDIDLQEIDEEDAVMALIEHYIAAFGPVTEEDIVWWIGLGKTKVCRALGKLQDKILLRSILGLDGDFIILRSDHAALCEASLSKKPAINLLPSLDPYLMGYKMRQRYLTATDTHKVFDRSGNVTSTILLKGRVVGVWDFEERETPFLKLHFFQPLPKDILERTYVEALRLGEFMAEGEVEIKECDSMPPLVERPAGSVMRPLKNC
jgi:hypothetical protein